LLTSVANATSQTTDNLIQNNESAYINTQQVIVLDKVPGSVDVKTNSKTTKQLAMEYFSDTPVLADIAYCESGFTQFNPDGTVLRGRVNSADVGLMQINEKYHADTAIKLGINIYTLEGNMAYARYLYNTYGTDPWVYSAKCWNNIREVALAK